MTELFAGMVWGSLELLMLFTGKAVVSVLSLGRWRGEAIGGNESRIHAGAGALSFVRDGRRVVTETGLLFIGITFYLAVVAVSLVLAAVG
jgi:hypothetical protein